MNNQIVIQASNFPLSQALLRHIERHLCHAPDTRDKYIQTIRVPSSDINGPHGGKEKSGQPQPVPAHLKDVLSGQIETAMYLAIDRATAHMSGAVARHLSKQSDNNRSTALADLASLNQQQ
ncbi:MAG: HPF/RaiA family ribosome-associated protein [Gammaproteobacteria bacterium]|nr:HPF/RaiA family ribosome-associated protein [Gammaproteobacteria bacterium]